MPQKKTVYNFRRLDCLQEAYLSSRSDKDFGALYVACLEGMAYLYDLYIFKKRIVLPVHRNRDDDIQDATTRFIMRFIRKPEYRVRSSFRQTLNFEILNLFLIKSRQEEDAFYANRIEPGSPKWSEYAEQIGTLTVYEDYRSGGVDRPKGLGGFREGW